MVGPGIKPQTSRTDLVVTTLTGQLTPPLLLKNLDYFVCIFQQVQWLKLKIVLIQQCVVRKITLCHTKLVSIYTRSHTAKTEIQDIPILNQSYSAQLDTTSYFTCVSFCMQGNTSQLIWLGRQLPQIQLFPRTQGAERLEKNFYPLHNRL